MKYSISFIVYFFSFLFNKLYYWIFKVLKRYIFQKPSKNKIYYLTFVFILFFFTCLKIYFFIYVYILFLYKILFRIYIKAKTNLKKKLVKILYFVFYIYFLNLLIHLKVLNKKIQDVAEFNPLYHSLKWNCFYYYFYIKYIFKDLLILLAWLILLLYSKFIYYIKIKQFQFIYYIKLFINGFLGIYFYYFIESLINNFKKAVKLDKNKKKAKKRSFFFRVKNMLKRIKYTINAMFKNFIKEPFFVIKNLIISFVDFVTFSLFKTGGNYIIYYIYKFIKYFHSICVYIIESDIIYRFLKFISRKKW